MYQVRIHGRGGQGLAATADLLSSAAAAEGRHARSASGPAAVWPGMPAEAYCWIARTPVHLPGPVRSPDAVILQDATVRHRAGVFAGLAPGGFVLVNSSRDWDHLGLDRYAPRVYRQHTAVLPATQLAVQRTGLPLPGAALAGGFAALTGVVSLESVVAAIRRRLPLRLAGASVDAASDAYARVRAEVRVPAGA